jgi:hypothetical protein
VTIVHFEAALMTVQVKEHVSMVLARAIPRGLDLRAISFPVPTIALEGKISNLPLQHLYF